MRPNTYIDSGYPPCDAYELHGRIVHLPYEVCLRLGWLGCKLELLYGYFGGRRVAYRR